jgi:RNA polymerase sigma-70 factor (ECF subfamily)
MPQPKGSEPEQIALARQGDPAAWEALVRAHQEAVFRMAYLLLGDPDDAQDAAQEAFVRAYTSLRRFDPERPLRPWLLRIVSNLARNRQRSFGRYFAALTRYARADPEALVQRGPEQPADLGELWDAVRRLPPDSQRAVYLRYFLEMSESEIASTLQVAPGTVKSRLHRALIRLRAIIQRDFPGLKEVL